MSFIFAGNLFASQYVLQKSFFIKIFHLLLSQPSYQKHTKKKKNNFLMCKLDVFTLIWWDINLSWCSRNMCVISCVVLPVEPTWFFLELYMILLPVFIQNHWGMGWFCFCLLARSCFILKVLWDINEDQSLVLTTPRRRKREKGKRVGRHTEACF